MNEENLRQWERIPDFENYAINNEGEIINWNTGVKLKQYYNNHGTKYVRLWKDNKEYIRSVAVILKKVFDQRYYRGVDDYDVYTRPVICIDEQKIFDNERECAKYYDANLRVVLFVLSRKGVPLKGHKIMYKDEYDRIYHN